MVRLNRCRQSGMSRCPMPATRRGTMDRGGQTPTGRSCRCETVRRMQPELAGLGGRDSPARTVQRVWPALRHRRNADRRRAGFLRGPRPDPGQLPALRGRHPSGSRSQPLVAGRRNQPRLSPLREGLPKRVVATSRTVQLEGGPGVRRGGDPWPGAGRGPRADRASPRAPEGHHTDDDEQVPAHKGAGSSGR